MAKQRVDLIDPKWGWAVACDYGCVLIVLVLIWGGKKWDGRRRGGGSSLLCSPGGGEGPVLPAFSAGLITGIMLPSTFGLPQPNVSSLYPISYILYSRTASYKRYVWGLLKEEREATRRSKHGKEIRLLGLATQKIRQCHHQLLILEAASKMVEFREGGIHQQYQRISYVHVCVRNLPII